MPRVDTFRKLLTIVSSSILALLGIVGFVRVGIMAKIFGAQFANQYVYPIAGMVLQILACTAIVVILFVIVWAFYDYFHNYFPTRNKGKDFGAVNKQIQEHFKKLKRRGDRNG